MLCVCECVCEWLCVNVVCVWASVWVNVCESVMCVCECVCDCVWMCVCERVCEWICVRVLCVWVSVWRCGNEADCGLPWAPCRDGPLHPIFGQSWVSQLGKPWSQGWGKELHPREWRAQGLWHLCHRSKSLSRPGTSSCGLQTGAPLAEKDHWVEVSTSCRASAPACPRGILPGGGA